MSNNDINSISIIGCGWLGLPLAKYLIKKKYKVKGSTTKVEKLNLLKEEGIEPFCIHLKPDAIDNSWKNFFLSELLIVNIPPGKDNLYLLKMENLITCIRNSDAIKYIIFISSTSVYPENNSTIDEHFDISNTSDTNIQLLKAENLFKNLKDIQCTIIRLAGLIGPKRNPGRFLADKKDIPNGMSPVNLIHLDDCIGIITAVIEQNFWNDVINGVCPHHPEKIIFYKKATEMMQLNVPSFKVEKNKYKIISSGKVAKSLKYNFIYNDLFEALKYC